jgi:adenylate cyclase
MGKEIERKFIVEGTGYRRLAEPVAIRQGYLSTNSSRAVRVRIKADKAMLTIKGTSDGIVRDEFEYEIPLADAEQMLKGMCVKSIIEKKRYEFKIDGLDWCVDEFEGQNEGLILAEVELENARQQVNPPEWTGKEVSDRPEYFNCSLVNNPYCNWK